jgi:hypothetical protein
MIVEDTLPAIYTELYLRSAGALFEPQGSAGLAGATVEMLREGTKTRTSEQIAAAMDKLGATLSASSGFGSPEVVLSAAGLSANFDAWFAVFSDILLHPAFPADELNKKSSGSRSTAPTALSPNFFSRSASRAVFGNHPAAVVSPSAESGKRCAQASPSGIANGILRARHPGRRRDVHPAGLATRNNPWALQTGEVGRCCRTPLPFPPGKVYLPDRPLGDDDGV